MAAKQSPQRLKIEVENGNIPGYVPKVDAVKYAAMKAVILKILPLKPPGMTQTEMRRLVLPHLPENEFPGGARADWLSKFVQFCAT